MEANKESKFFVIGIVKWKKETQDVYGPKTNLLLELVKTNMPDMSRLLMVVAQRSLAAIAAARPKKVQVMIWFDRHAVTTWKSRPIVKVKAKKIEGITWEAIDAMSYNQEGQYDPVGTIYRE